MAAAAAAAAAAESKEGEDGQASADPTPKNDPIGQQYSMLNYAKMYFADSPAAAPGSPSPQKGGLMSKLGLKKAEKEEAVPVAWGWTDLVKKIKHSKVPITAPLTKIYDPAESELCIELFKVIMRFMGDYPTKQSAVDLGRYVVGKCLELPVIRDEVYCQIIKQVTSHPNRRSSSCRHGWELLSICAGFFPPSETFEPYLRKFVQTYSSDPNTEFHEIAKKSESKIRAIKKFGPRKYPPTQEEIFEPQGRHLFVKVIFPDDSVKAVEILSSTTGKEFTDSICARLGLDHPEEFSLFVSTKGKEYMLLSHFFVMDAVTELELLREKERTMSKKTMASALAALEYQFLFRKFLWPARREINFKNEQLVGIIFSQSVKRILNGDFRVTQDDVLELAATRVKCAEREGDPERTAKQREEYYEQFILPSYFKAHPASEWVRQIDAAVGRYRGKSAHELRSQLVRRIMTWSAFGDTSYVLDSPKYEKVELPREVVLTINSDGIRLVHPEKKTALVSHTYQEISSWSFGPDYIKMKTGGMVQRAQRNMKATTDLGEEICLIISYYVGAIQNKAAAAADQRNPTMRR